MKILKFILSFAALFLPIFFLACIDYWFFNCSINPYVYIVAGFFSGLFAPMFLL